MDGAYQFDQRTFQVKLAAAAICMAKQLLKFPLKLKIKFVTSYTNYTMDYFAKYKNKSSLGGCSKTA